MNAQGSNEKNWSVWSVEHKGEYGYSVVKGDFTAKLGVAINKMVDSGKHAWECPRIAAKQFEFIEKSTYVVTVIPNVLCYFLLSIIEIALAVIAH